MPEREESEKAASGLESDRDFVIEIGKDSVVLLGGNDAATKRALNAFLAAYVGLCLFTFFCMTLVGVDSTNSFTIALSCAGNVGPTLGLEIGPTMSWAVLPMGVKWLLSGLMLMGRLEIFTVLVLFTKAFWKEN